MGTTSPSHARSGLRRARSRTTLRRVLTGLVALVAAGSAVTAAALPAEAATSGPVVGVASSRCLDVAGNTTAPGTRVIIYDCNGGANQTWTLTSAGELRAFGGRRCLDVRGGRLTAGAVVQSYYCTGGANQKWTVRADGTIRATQTGLCLDVSGASTANLSYVQTWGCNGGGNQAWRSVLMPTPTATPTPTPTPTPTAPGPVAPVPGYTTLVQDDNFGSAKATVGAIKDLPTLWSRWQDHVFWQAPALPGQAIVQPDRLDLTMVSANGAFKSVYIESNFVLDPAKSYYVESRLKTPGVSNIVPALWLYANSPDVVANRNGSEGWQSEIDLMEQFTPTFGDNTKVFSTTHHAPNHSNLSQSIATTTDLSTSYHTIGLEYTPTRIRFYLDGQPSSAWFDYVWSTPSTPNAPPAIVLDIESASTLGTGGTPSVLPNTMSVDFVRVWQSGS